MSIREKMIIGLMVLAVGYGVYTVFLAGPQEETAFKSDGDKDLKALKLFIDKVADNTKNSLSKQQAYVLQKAQIEWKRDPLLQIKQKLSPEEKEQHRPLSNLMRVIVMEWLESKGIEIPESKK